MAQSSKNDLSKTDRSSEYEDEKHITNSRKNRSFIDHILKSNDEHAIKKLFEEYFYLHAKKNKQDRISWDELCFIINEILERNNDQVTLSEATSLFYQMYQLQYPSSVRTATENKEEKPLLLKKTKSEEELLPKLKERDMLKSNKKTRNDQTDGIFHR